MINLEAGPSQGHPIAVETNPVTFVGGNQTQKADGVNQTLYSVLDTGIFSPGDILFVHNLNGQAFTGTVSGISTDSSIIFDKPITIDVSPGAAVVKISQIQILDQWVPLTVIQDLTVGGLLVATPQVPSTAKFLGIAVGQQVPNGGGQTLIANPAVRGNQTGTLYIVNAPATVGVAGFMVIPINGVADSTYRISWNTALSIGKAYLYTSTLGNPFPSLGQEQMGQSVPVVIASDQSTLAVNPPAYTAKGSNHPATGTVASVVLAATPGQTYTCHLLKGGLLSTTAASHTVLIQLLDGATLIYTEGLATSATIGTNDHAGFVGAAYRGTLGNSMTANFSANGTGGDESINIAGYLQ